MERSQLLYVVTAAECGNITRAAEKLHLSQPSLSNQIIHLERELGVALFSRTRKRIYLTEAGKAFVQYARRILNDMQALGELMEDYAANRDGRVRIGALPIMCSLRIPELVHAFHSWNPNITLSLQERGSVELLHALEQNDIDVAFAIINPSEPSMGQMNSLPLVQSEVCAAVHVDNPLSRQKTLDLKQLVDQVLITPNQDFNLSGIILSHLASLGIQCQVQNVCSQIDSCLALVNKNMGVSFCTRTTAEYYHYPDVVALTLDPAIQRTVYLVYKKDPRYDPALEQFIRFSQRFLREHTAG